MCDSKDGFSRETAVITCADFIVLHLKRFDNSLSKVTDTVCCFPDALDIPLLNPNDTIGNISLPVNCDDVQFSAMFRLCGTINHSGTVSAGHYWAYVRAPGSDAWYSCEDRIVRSVSPSVLNNSSSYLLFYQRK